MSTDDGFDARDEVSPRGAGADRAGGDADATDPDAPDTESVSALGRMFDPPPSTTTGSVPTITGLFDVISDDEDEDEDDDEDRDDDAGEDASDDDAYPAQPETDSIRLIGEMFGGFRRRDRRRDGGLEQMLGSATQSLPVIADGRVLATGGIPAVPPAGSVAAEQLAEAPQEPLAPEAQTPDDGAEPATHAGAIPIIVPEEQPAAATAPSPDAAPGESAPPAPAAASPAEPAPGASTVRTAYVPQDADDQTQQALAWLTAESVGTGQVPIVGGSEEPLPSRRGRVVGAIVAPILTAIILAVAYVVTFAVWPLSSITPSLQAAQVEAPTAAPAQMPWPELGSAALSIEGTGEVLSSATAENPEQQVPLASLTKVISVMVILDRLPLEPGEQGPEIGFGFADQNEYWAYTYRNESALEVPVDGTLTEYQLLEGILLGSAGNYLNKLIDYAWDYDRDAFVLEALGWLEENGIDGISLVEPTGIRPDNVGTPSAILRVAEVAMQHPVVAEIVAKDEVELPGAGIVENSNPLSGEEGIVGLKTGAIWPVPNIWNLLTVKQVALGDGDPTRVYAAVLGQDSEDARADVSRQLLDAATQALQPVEVLPAGTVVATATTPWGASTDIVTSEAVSLTLWNGEGSELETDYGIDVEALRGADAGTLTVTGAMDSATVPLETSDTLERPSLQWRLTHPLDLLGITGS